MNKHFTKCSVFMFPFDVKGRCYYYPILHMRKLKGEKLNNLHKITHLVSNRGKFEWKRFALTTYTPNILLFQSYSHLCDSRMFDLPNYGESLLLTSPTTAHHSD